jgi:hypothetical protein
MLEPMRRGLAQPMKDDVAILIAFLEDPDGHKIERTKALQDVERVLSVLSQRYATLNLNEK